MSVDLGHEFFKVALMRQGVRDPKDLEKAFLS